MTAVAPASSEQPASSEWIESLLAELTLDEKVLLLGGADFWHTPPVARLGIPALQLSDGPSGARGEQSVGTTSVSFPCGSAIGATFDTEAAAKLGAALADECLDRGIHVLLGPTVNLHRHPLGGRHFECYSEDPTLSARLAVAYVRALQARGVAATVKHFVANDTEFQRHTISSDVAERALRELYHVPFEATVHDADAWAVMSSYNKINGTYAAEHETLLAGTLRGDWGFGGAVISDWFGTQSTAPSAIAGLDLEMPGPPVHYGSALIEAAESGEVALEVIDDHVRRLLTLAIRTGALSPTGDDGDGAWARPPATTTVAERRAVARELVSSSFVLLKNEGPVLPLELAPGQTLAVIGPNAMGTAIQGGGSARVNPEAVRSVFQALHDRLTPTGVHVVHERGCITWSSTPALEGAFRLEYFAGTGFDAEDFDPVVRHTDVARLGSFTWLGSPRSTDSGLSTGDWVMRAYVTVVPEDDGLWTFSLAQVGTARLLVDGAVVVDARGEQARGKGFFGFGSEEVFGAVELQQGRPHEVVIEYSKQAGMPLGGIVIGAIPPVASDDELLRRAEMLASKADAVVCVLGTSAEWETEGHDRSSMDLPGLQDQLVRRLVLANARTCVLVNAGSPVTMDWADDVAALGQIWFAGEQAGEGVTDVLLGEADPGGRLPTTVPRRLEDTPAFPYYPGSDGHAPYGEGLLVGYRHYDTRFVEPRFAFGEGLSFTTFALSDLEVRVVGSIGSEPLHPGFEGPALVRVEVTLHNTGDRTGSDVVQVYVHRLDRRSDEPEQQLRAFEKLSLGAGSSRQLVFELTERDFAGYHEDRGFVVEPGRYEVRVGRSSRAIAQVMLVELG
jgi:beta-glucosidase